MPEERGAGDEIRCDCGRLLARRVQDGIEIKCRRCERSVVIRIPEDGSFAGPSEPE